MKKTFRFSIYLIPLLAFLLVLVRPLRLAAQYSSDVFDLHTLQEQYDERGFAQGKSTTVDGRVMVSNGNGGVSYSYPISNFKMGGYPFEVSLNYCGSVDFTTFRSYHVATELAEAYRGWNRFDQNRAAWILGINGFALNVISTASNFHSDPGSRALKGTKTLDDGDFIWTIEGYDFCNRMRDPGAPGTSGDFFDEIRLLRSDGSVLKLGHKTPRLGGIVHEADKRPEIYTGVYTPNEANSHAFGVVEYDLTYFTEGMKDAVTAFGSDTSQWYPHYPRKLHYYPGDGLEYVFREWNAPFGNRPFWYQDSLTATIWGGPTIFYLEEVRGSVGSILTFYRTRHYPIFGNPLLQSNADSTRGRAIITSFDGHDISFGYNSMTIEALGRTTTVKFDTLLRSGNAENWETMPYANNGSLTPASLQMARWDETQSALYKSFVGYVTQIVDPVGRVTKFDYQPYTRVYENFSFPSGSSGTPTMTFRNYRLKSVTEPDVKYNFYYHGSANETVDQLSMPSPKYKLANMVDSVVKADLLGMRLTKDVYQFPDYGTVTTPTVTTTDCISGKVRVGLYTYADYDLDNIIPGTPSPKQTTLLSSTEQSDHTISRSTTYTTTHTTKTGASVTLNYLRLPSFESVTEENQLKSVTTYNYIVDSVRTFDHDTATIRRDGWEVLAKIVQQRDPSNQSRILRTDTITYYNRNILDTNISWTENTWMKLATYQNYFYMKDTLQDSLVLHTDPEKLLYWPPVGVFSEETYTDSIHVPPQYGLELRSVSYDENGALIEGKQNVLKTSLKRGGYRELLGSITADSIIGRGGSRSILKGSYQYANGWFAANFPTEVRNATGAIAYYSNTPWFCWNNGVAQWDTCINDNLPVMATLRNDGTVANDYFYGSGLGGWFGLPLGEARTVRTYDSSLSLVRRPLYNFKERTFFGAVSGALDANGWYSKFEYDDNGRLARAWLPRDFPNDSARITLYDTTYYNSVEKLDFVGSTTFTRRIDSLYCYTDEDGIDHSKILTGNVYGSVFDDTLMAGIPVTVEPDCARPTIRDPKARGDDGGLQQTFVTKIPFAEVINCPTCDGYVGRLDQTVPGSIVSIDSANFSVDLSVADTKCTHVVISCPQLNLSRTYVFNCPSLKVSVASTKKDDGGSLQSIAPVPLATRFRIDLTPFKSQLLSLAGSGITFYVKTTTPGATVTFVQGLNAQDMRPRITVGGTFRQIRNLGIAGSTLAYTYDDANLASAVTAKIDDRGMTSNNYDPSYLGTDNTRYTTATHYFGAEGRLAESDIDFRLPGGSIRTDVVTHTYDGFGQQLGTTDQESDLTQTQYDNSGRPVTMINADGTFQTIAYKDSSAAYFGITDQDFFGFCSARVTTDEKGIKTAQYSDGFDRVRRMVVDSGGLNLTTRYEYDVFGHLLAVINPKGDTTKYWYDDFGRVKYKYQKDLGTISYAYDDVGNVRFTQSEAQARRSVVTFNEYDDLNRLTIAGEAAIAGEALPDSVPPTGTAPSLNRLTDRFDPNILHDSISTCLTAGKSLWLEPVGIVPTIWAGTALDSSNCSLSADTLLGETTAPVGWEMRHTVQFYNPTSTTAGAGTFEDISRFHDFVRLAVSYDAFPMTRGGVWSRLPSKAQWDSLAPTGRVRNLLEHEAVVAYREHGGEPFHYSVMSYDERGRVEALMRYTENLGFDAVYYQYNSMNRVISVRVVDPLRQYTTWYGYDHNGRVDSVWTLLQPLWSGAGVKTPHYVAPATRPQYADIVYRYTPTGKVDSTFYAPVGVLVKYAYDHRKWLDSMVATQTGSPLFKQVLGYDSTGQIVQQRWQHGINAPNTDIYGYDNADRLTAWYNGVDTTKYDYDEIGNRHGRYRTTIADASSYTYGDPVGPDRLTETQRISKGIVTTTDYDFDRDGAVTGIRRSQTGSTPSNDSLFYSWRDLTRQYTHHMVRSGSVAETEDWRYRYSAGGEREQKRLYLKQDSLHNPVAENSWVYYLLGGSKEQLAVYHGQEQLLTGCSGTYSVYLYPTEYNTFGIMYPGAKEDIASVTTVPDALVSSGRKEFKITDHLSSTRVVVSFGQPTQTYDYEPFGGLRPGSPTGPPRQGFNGREDDRESGQMNLGVRQYSDEADGGRFLRIDPKWEKFSMLSPYVYSNNNPLNYTDPNGDQARLITGPILSGPLNPIQKALFKFVSLIAKPQALVAAMWANKGRAEGAARAMQHGPFRTISIKGYGEFPLGNAPSFNMNTDHPVQTGPSAHNDAIDAFRHAFWSAMNARDAGVHDAIVIGHAHELENRAVDNQPVAEEHMDTFNNYVGAQIGGAHPNATDEELESLVLDALKSGMLQVTLSPNSIGNADNRALWDKMFNSAPNPSK